jgi:aspartate aminotransferase
VTTSAATVGQQAALAALRGPQEPVEAMRAEFDARRQIMYRALLQIPAVACNEPQGAFYCLPDVSAYLPATATASGRPRSDEELADWLLSEVGVATVPGSGFGAPGHLRLSYALSRPQLQSGIERLARGLAQLGPQ